MAGLGADGGMAQTIAHGFEAANPLLKLIGLGRQHLALDLRLFLGWQHGGDLLKGKARGAAQGYDGQLIEDMTVKHTPLPLAAYGLDQPFLFIKTDGGGAESAALRDF